MWWILGAFAAPPDWEDVVVQGLHRDDVWMATGELSERLDALCSEGLAGACRWAEAPDQVRQRDVQSVGRRLAPDCERGDAVACLAEGWALAVDDEGRLSADRAADPEAALARFEQACDGGLARGCTAVARAHRWGVGTYASESKAKELLTPICRDGEARACRELAELTRDEAAADAWRRAVELGDPVAAWLQDPSAAPEACQAGAVPACEAVAMADAGGALDALKTACTLGHRPSCARRWVLEDVDDATRVDRLNDVARDWEPARGWASLARHGGTISPWSTGRTIPKADLRSLPASLHAALRPCYLQALGTEDVSGWADVVIQVDEHGEIAGAAMEGDWVPPALAACAFEAAKGAQKLSEGSGPLVQSVRVPFAHEARFKLRAVVANSTRDITTTSESMTRWSPAIEACLVGRGAMVDKRPRVRLKIRRNGDIVKAKVEQSSGLPAVDACIVETLLEQRTEPLVTSLPVSLEVSFFEPAELEEPPGVVYRTGPHEHEGPAHVERVLVLALMGNQVDGHRARLGAKSIASLTEAYAETAAWLAQHTGGALELDVTVREVDAALRQELGSDDRSVRWHVDRHDLPDELVATIEPATWDHIQLWAPLPRGAPQASLGVAWRDRTLRGARFTTGALASGREITMGDKPIELAVLQGLYLHWRDRASAHLGATLPPNDRVLRLEDGSRRDPRPWTDEPMAFYEHVFHNDLVPSFWGDLTTYGDEQNRALDGNLAYRATAFGSEDVVLADYLNDGVLVAGREPAAAFDTADDASQAMFGLAWPEPVRLRRIEATLLVGEGAPPSVSVEIARDGGWLEVAKAPCPPDGALEITFDPKVTGAVRLLVDHATERGVIELAAYGPDRR